MFTKIQLRVWGSTWLSRAYAGMRRRSPSAHPARPIDPASMPPSASVAARRDRRGVMT